MDGLWPYDIEVSYLNSGSKGSVTDHDVATLSLEHLEGITISQIDVYLRSNKSSGAGSLDVAVNGSLIANKTGSFADWVGYWDNQSYHAISLLSQAVNGVETLDISLTGTANSLHIEKFVVTWEPTEAHTVTLMRGNRTFATLTETAGMQGVLLPEVPDSMEWKFRGWSETFFWSATEAPVCLAPNTLYYPSRDANLWAVFEYVESSEQIYATELTDGNYRYVNIAGNIALTGVPGSGIMHSETINLTQSLQVYTITFSDSVTAYITHTKTGTPIGYSGTQLAAVATPWKVYHDGEETLFYMVSGNKSYILWLNIMTGDGKSVYAGLLNADPGSSPMRLMPVVESSETPYFTCNPEIAMGVEQTEQHSPVTEERVIMYLGNYKMTVKDGKKQLQLW